ncbi:LysE family transporter [Campylobacter sp. MIT 21-1685]|uniref:LysE family transporter n=1 Tax=unclassified Campylobacter TaxID=2593542 RepID=UPI00224A8F30|nr:MULTISPECIES: LysE family transporter [unclassified Campylobacter]MCX2683840.1 LysE family transporter [Campylobacter sp. MIT 21-1684]MCX2752124.1 LysE family transporter [Campylobacter sp. MIT 21-1682]MCX2808319.1 LysE family transporter [Campylobacter sp. MIT 21-1685]
MNFVLILVIHFFALLTPGPDFFMISTYALKTNFKKTFLVVLGVCAAIFLWIVLSLSGLKILFETFPLVKIVLTLLAVFYLSYLAFLLLKNLKQKENFENVNFTNKPFIRGFITNMSNSKALFYFSSIFSSLNFSSSFFNLSFLVFLLVAESFFYFLFVALFFSNPNVKNLYLKHCKKIDCICALIFICFVYLF